jgi:MFS family permease
MSKNKRILDLIPKQFSRNTFVYFLIPLFLILLGDGIVAYIFPLVLGNHVSSNLIIGLIMSASSVTSIACDFLIPLVFPKYGWKFQLITGIILALTFPLITALGDTFSIVWLFLIASLMWGIYYEFIMFAQQSFVVEEEDQKHFSHDWSIVEILTNIVEVSAPIIGAFILIRGIVAYTSVTLVIEILALIFAILLVLVKRDVKMQKPKSQIKEYISFFKELKSWKILSKKVYIVLIMAVIVEMVSAGFLTFAGLYGEQLIGNPDWNWALITIATIPYMFGSIIIYRLNMKKGKKRIAQLSILTSGIILSLLFFFGGKLIPILVLIFISNLIMSLCWPLDDAIFSDLQKRLGKHGLHLIGLSQASYSIAYLVAPAFMGFLADRVGYNNSFAIIGVIAAVIGLILLIITPRKLRMPHKELDNIVTS